MKRSIIMILILVGCIGCDQTTKYTAKHVLEGQPTRSYMGDSVRLCYVENNGALLSLGAGMPENTRHTLFTVIIPLGLIAFMIFVICNKKGDAAAALSGTLIIGGGLGNWIDRIVNQGAVIDFMNIGIGPIRTGIFNVADLAIMAGTIMFAVTCSRKSHNRADPFPPGK